MVVLGIVAGVSGTGKGLKDGGAALLVDGRLVSAIAEERLVRVKRAGGWARSAAYCLDAAGVTPRDVNVVAYSTCCDSMHDMAGDVRLMADGFPRARIMRAPHHLSHALYAYYGSPFDRALVVVGDAGGNVDVPVNDEWWSAPREQTSYFEVDEEGYRLLDRDFDEPYAAGFGEVFRAMTYYLGWNGSRHASKTMALSAFGDASALGLGPFFSVQAGTPAIRTAVVNDPPAPLDMIARAFGGTLGQLVRPRQPGEPPDEPHMHLAALLQSSYEDAVGRRIAELTTRWGLADVCLSGGVAYNCQANAHVAAQPEVDRVYVPPAPGDTGQPIGNALWAHRRLARIPVDRASIADPYTGREYDPSAGARLRPPPGLAVQSLRLPSARAVSLLVAAGWVVGHFRGRSEIGARALGNRSIFADPRRPSMVDALNARKGREGIMPFGGTILAAEMSRLFTGVRTTPYMQFVLEAGAEAERLLPAIVHRDRSSRLQSVDGAPGSSWLRAMLTEFGAVSGVPAVLNTSLNGSGEPIVETPDEAVRLLGTGVVDCLVVGDAMVVQRDSPVPRTLLQGAAVR